MAKIIIQNTEIAIVRYNDDDYISLTDMARSQMQEHIIFRWLSLKSTIEYLGEWEMLYNPNFNCIEFDTIKNELICLSNMENLNAVFIEQGLTQNERLLKLNQIAIHQMNILENSANNRNILK